VYIVDKEFALIVGVDMPIIDILSRIELIMDLKIVNANFGIFEL